MGKILKIEKLAGTRFVSLYQIHATSVHQTPVSYYLASRTRETEELKVTTRENHPDGVVIYALYGPRQDRVVLIRQYRYTIGDYIYEFPAGLIEKGESPSSAAIREMREETGLTLTPACAPEAYQRPFYTTIGLTDESCATVYGYADGEISTQGEEDSEENEVVLVDRKEAARILKEENTALICAYHLMHFISDEQPFRFLEEKAYE